MPHGDLYIFVEGDDDRRFFESVIVPELVSKGTAVRIVDYAQKPGKFEYVARYSVSVASMGGMSICVVDINNCRCVSAKKESVATKLRSFGAKSIDVFVVVKEIESWYLAGVPDEEWPQLGIEGRVPRTTDDLGKENFNALIPRRFGSRLDFMIELLKRFSPQVAMRKNKSFSYWMSKYDCENARV